MTALRDYSSGTRSGLFALSRGYCYEPDCKDPVVRFVHDEPVVNVEIAHIIGLKLGSARHDATQSVEFLDSFDNLILLCTVHHKVVDRLSTQAQYPVGLLRSWKRIRENGLNLTGLDNLTQDSLEVLLAGVVDSARHDILAAIDLIAESNKEIAAMLRTLVEERFERPYLDPDIVSLLANSADKLTSLPDHAALLSTATAALASLPDTATSLSSAAASVRGLGDVATAIDDAAGRLQNSVYAMQQNM